MKYLTLIYSLKNIYDDIIFESKNISNDILSADYLYNKPVFNDIIHLFEKSVSLKKDIFKNNDKRF